MSTSPSTLSRRDFLAVTGASGVGLLIGFFLPQGGRRALAEPPPAAGSMPNAFIRIAPDNTITMYLKHVEMGQGVATSMPMVIAEELDCDWSKVGFEHAPADKAYAHTAYGMQMTGGSSSTWESFDQLRTAGATARTMLVAAAAAKWGVEASACATANSVVSCGDKQATYGELAEAASKLKAPANVPLRDPKTWKIIGKPTPRLDTPDKVMGRAEFGMDVRLPGMVYAAVVRPPRFGAKMASFNADHAKTIPGVTGVYAISSGVAVVATNTWAARRGIESVEVQWEKLAAIPPSSEAMRESYRQLAATPGAVAKTKGNADAAIKGAAKQVEALYEVPYEAHAMMETLNCTVDLKPGGCDIWTGTQMPGVDQVAAAKVAGLNPSQVRIHTPLLGGGFGRRANPRSDFVVEAVEVAKAVGKPVQVFWTREDDIRGGYYRPMGASRMRAGLDASGMPVGWTHTVVCQSIVAGTPFAMMIKDGVDGTSVEGAADSPYIAAIPDHRVELHSPQYAVPVLWWRSVGHSHTGFAVECFVDELAHAAGKDPVEYRRTLLKDYPRHLAALNLAAEKFGWGKGLPKGHGAGIAVHESFRSYVAHAAEVSVEGGKVRVHRVVCAIECGPVVNPSTVEAQMQSCIAFALSATLLGEITLTKGVVDQSNFHDFPILRLPDMPAVEVYIVPSTEKMGGVGEPGVPPVAPAVANAVFALTGERLRSLPLRPTKK